MQASNDDYDATTETTYVHDNSYKLTNDDR